MLKIIHQSLVTYKGIDFERLLVRDDSLNGQNPCDFCVYNTEDFPLDACTCLDVHRPGYDDTYFILRFCPKLK